MVTRRYIPSTPEAIVSILDEKRGTLSMAAVAKILGVTSSNISGWRKGHYAPHPRVLEKLGLRPCLEVVDDSPLSIESPPAPKTREQQLMEENRRLKKELRAALKAAQSTKTEGKRNPLTRYGE